METAKAELKEIEGKEAEVNRIIRRHMWGAMGAGLIPLPVVDFIALTGIQLDMINGLSKLFGVEFSKEKGKAILTSLLGGLFPASVGGSLASLIKFIPVIGQTAGAVAMPAIGGASTYAVGRVFALHFASGGTLLDFDTEKVRTYFSEKLKEGEKVAAQLKKGTG